MHHIKKGFDCKKNRICFETEHTKKVVLIKTGFAWIKKGFSKIKFGKENKRKEKLFFQYVPWEP